MTDTSSPTFATLDDIDQRYPRELAVLAADESTGVRDDGRINAVLGDVSTEIRSILLQRYRKDELARLDADSMDLMRAYAIPMALYRVSVSFARSSERLEKGYDAAVKSLQAIGAGKGALTFDPDPDALAPAVDPGQAEGGNTTVLFEGNERLFTRNRTRGL